jgi:hypothetical protein
MTARRSHRWTPRLLAGTLLATLAAGCESPAGPTQITTEVFSGTVAVGGLDTKTFQVTYSKLATDGAMAITSLTTAASGTPVVTTMGLGFGSVNANGVCRLDAARTTVTAQVNQILTATSMFAAGTYCIQIFDPGTLTEPLAYTVVIEHY